MAKRTVALDKATMTAVAGLATIVAANIMIRLYSRGIFTDEDLNFVIEETASGGLGDPSLEAMAKSMAETLLEQITSRMH
jgi:hypothetical protein